MLPDDVRLSFEFFPPKTEQSQNALQDVTQILVSNYNPDFVSVTYGAGGSTQDKTLRTLSALKPVTDTYRSGLSGHLTCVGRTKQEVNDVIQAYQDIGANHIVALRGDSPDGIGERFVPHPQGYPDSLSLIRQIRQQAPNFCISVAAYPDPHPDSQSMQADIDYLKAKFDAGATQAITQFFFTANGFLHFRDRAVQAGIQADTLIAGILPISDFTVAKKFADKCGVPIDADIQNLYQYSTDNNLAISNISCYLTVNLCQTLYKSGVRRFHFYSLNQSALLQSILSIWQYKNI